MHHNFNDKFVAEILSLVFFNETVSFKTLSFQQKIIKTKLKKTKKKTKKKKTIVCLKIKIMNKYMSCYSIYPSTQTGWDTRSIVF